VDPRVKPEDDGSDWGEGEPNRGSMASQTKEAAGAIRRLLLYIDASAYCWTTTRALVPGRTRL
jgi:hypothetical protein